METALARRLARGMSWLKAREMWVAAIGVCVITVAVFISCATVSRVTVVPPNIPGAEFAGSDSCAQCHEDITRDFKTATHARLKAEGKTAANIGCESCHGPGSLHNESGGERNTIINPKKSPQVCFQCHLDKRGQFSLPHHHPVLEGKVSCTDCHQPHKGPAVIGGGTQLMSRNETCGQCHTAQFGPFVFEHEAVREGCTTCHQPHGTVNDRMLISRNATLCLKCHFEQQTSAGKIFIGEQDHTSRLARGTCWSAGCHEAMHGSQIGRALRY